MVLTQANELSIRDFTATAVATHLGLVRQPQNTLQGNGNNQAANSRLAHWIVDVPYDLIHVQHAWT